MPSNGPDGSRAVGGRQQPSTTQNGEEQNCPTNVCRCHEISFQGPIADLGSSPSRWPESRRHKEDCGGNMRRSIPIAFAGVFLAALMSSGVALAQQKSLALVTNASADFWTIARRGVDKAQQEHPDYKMEVIVTGQATAAEQRRDSTICSRAVSRGSRSRPSTRRIRSRS